MNSKEIKKQQAFLNCYKTLTDEQKLKLKELSLREMIMSCLIYGEDIFTSVCINACSEYYHRPYAEEYIGEPFDYETLKQGVCDTIISNEEICNNYTAEEINKIKNEILNAKIN